MSTPRARNPLSEQEWRAELERALDHPVRVVYGRSLSAPIQMRAPTARELAQDPALRGGLVLRLHALFERTPPEVRAAIASWMRSGRRARRACRTMSAWMEAELAALPEAPPAPVALEPRGLHHDLGELASGLFRDFFARDFEPPRARPALTWGRRARSRSRSSLRLGSFEPSQALVRVHPVLDQPPVPPWFVRYVLFHEILHAAVPREKDRAGRSLHHGPEFRRREAAYPDLERALRWEKRHVGALIRSVRTGRPLRLSTAPARHSKPERGPLLRQLDLFRR